MGPKVRLKHSSAYLGGIVLGEILHEALACRHICTWPLSKGVKDGHTTDSSHTGICCMARICCVPTGHWKVDTYLLCLFVWSSDGAEKNGAQTQALPHGPDL